MKIPPYLFVLMACLPVTAHAESTAPSLGHVDHLAFRTVERRQHASLNSLLSEGTHANLRASDGTTLLMYAALHGDAKTVRILLEAGADPNASNHEGTTALIWGSADIKKVRLLVKAGADIHAKSSTNATPLNTAVSHVEGAESVDYLLTKGADPSIIRNNRNLLSVAAFTGSLPTVNVLLRHASKDGRKDLPVGQALGAAIDQGHREIALHLLRWDGPKPLSQEVLNRSLRQALLYPDRELARMLMDRGAKVPNVLPLVMSDTEETATLQRLIDGGANVHAEAFRGYSAVDLARLRGHRENERLLVAAGVKSGAPLKEKAVPQREIELTSENQRELVTHAVSKSMNLLLRTSDIFLQNREGCASCHNQDLPAVAASISLSRGIELPREPLQRIAHRQLSRWADGLSNTYARAPVFPDSSKQFGYLLWNLSSQGVPPNPVTKAAVWHLAGTQLPQGQWQGHSPRMPSQDGAHMATALAIRGLQAYPIEGREKEWRERVSRARRWLERNDATLHTHRAFRLLGLAWANARGQVMKEAIENLLATQKPDGGWSQLKNLESDAWATGLALLGLHAAGITTDHDAYHRGITFLLRTQFDDGSWFVRSRAFPFQPHFDSQFPFGWDQWISSAGTALAAASLALSVDPSESQVISPSSYAALIAPMAAERKAAATDFVFHGERTVTFAKDILPILEDSCLDCHSGDQTKGGFKVTDRASLIAGGESGVPTLLPGQGQQSQLIRHITDQIEDMEMPPLRKRKSYPALTKGQVQTLTTWIDEGAHWPQGLTLEE